MLPREKVSTGLRIQREREFQKKKVTEEVRAPVAKWYSITRRSREFYEGVLRSNCQSKRVLDCGAGSGNDTFYLAKNGAIVTGIDISDITIEKAKRRAFQEDGVSNASFLIMNAEELKFDNNYFDIVCGNAVLHHLDLNRALGEITRALKPNGKAVFIEPLGDNFFINLYRRLTPQFRSGDEHPLLNGDLRLMQCYFGQVDIRYFHLTSLLTIPFRKLAVFAFLLKTTETIDRLLFKLAFFKKRAWRAVIMLSKPRKGTG